MIDLTSLNIELHSLVIFRDLLADAAIARLSELLACEKGAEFDALERVSRYSAFAYALFGKTRDWTEYVLEKTLESENIYSAARARRRNRSRPVGLPVE